MPRVYMHLDPHVYDRKVLGIDHHGAPIEGWQPYPGDALVAFFGVLALAELQPERGRFRSERILRELLRGADGRGARYARQVPLLLERGDLVATHGSQLYVDGWDEWQEGNVTPPARAVAVARRRGDEPPPATPGAIRQRRFRERHRDVTGASPANEPVTRYDSSSGGYSGGIEEAAVTAAETRANGAPTTFMGYRPKKPKMTQAEALADIERQHAESLADAVAKARAKEAQAAATKPAPTARPRSAAG